MKENANFTEITKKYSFDGVHVSEPTNNPFDKVDNTVLEVRIISIDTDELNKANVKLIFRLLYYVSELKREFTIFLVLKIDVLDKNRELEKNPTSDISASYIAIQYKEFGERLFKELIEQLKEKFSIGIIANSTIDMSEAIINSRICLANYYGTHPSK